MSLPSSVVDLAARRERAQRAIAEVAAAPVRFFPDELLIALQGSWGEIEPQGDARVLTLAR